LLQTLIKKGKYDFGENPSKNLLKDPPPKENDAMSTENLVSDGGNLLTEEKFQEKNRI
jgi:hypothetical protein